MGELLHIGTVELVSLPDDQINGVPAKIDTGADGSAIWASNIVMKDGELSFNFFAPGSAYYGETPVVTTAFKTTKVKNSFGHEEFRYKIRLRVQVGKKRLLCWFSLADRSRNIYPILLGKNFLNQRFVVDVSQNYLLSQGAREQTVLVLSRINSQDFFDQVSARNATPVKYMCCGYASLIYYINGLNTRVTSTLNNKDIADYTLTYFKSHTKSSEFAAAAATYLRFKGKPFIDRELRDTVSESKLTEYMKLACYDLPLPTSICADTKLLVGRYDELVKQLGVPFVLKEIASDRGSNNYLINSEKDFTSILSTAPEEHAYIAQQYIENDGFLRLYVMGKEISLAIWRSPHPHNDRLKAHLNKPHGSANATKQVVADVAPEVRELALKAASCMDRQIAGVDLIQDKRTGTWYILEVNNGPQLKGGSFVDDKITLLAKFFDKELKR